AVVGESVLIFKFFEVGIFDVGGFKVLFLIFEDAIFLRFGLRIWLLSRLLPGVVSLFPPT
ncbi:MAG: hypothetical protein KBF95_01770, partial [Dysgonomonadaceae bacterium]|nr:hypothetical protein [Dysgonamonadaceae bacterium]